MYVAQDENGVDRILVRVSGLTLQIEPDLRASSDLPTRPGARHTRDSHGDIRLRGRQSAGASRRSNAAPDDFDIKAERTRAV